MPVTVLVPHETPERCYLKEALLWVAFYRFPLEVIGENLRDIRDDWDHLEEGIAPRIPNDAPISTAECLRAGLPPNPEYELYEKGEILPRTEDLEQLLSLDDLDAEVRERWGAELAQAMAFEAEQELWDEEYLHYLDTAKAKMLLALREGKVKAYGIQLECATIAASLEHLEATEWPEWGTAEWKPIDPSFWNYNGIDWDDCHAEGRGKSYALILVETDPLMERFRCPLVEPVAGLLRIGDDLVLPETFDLDLPQKSNRGRPALDWDAFHLEMASRVKNGGLPVKQEALIADMQQWCLKTWGRPVARSTLLPKIKPFYDRFVRMSENPQ